LFSFKFNPDGWYVFQHLGEAPFESFYRNFPAIRAIYFFAQDRANDIDKGLQDRTSVAGFLVVIAGRWKAAMDVINDLITENEGLLVS